MISELEHLNFLLSAENRAALIAKMRELQQTHGRAWLEQFKKDYGVFSDIIDLIANHDAQNALPKFLDHIKGIIKTADFDSEFLRTIALGSAETLFNHNKQTLLSIHAELKAEIDKPRF